MFLCCEPVQGNSGLAAIAPLLRGVGAEIPPIDRRALCLELAPDTLIAHCRTQLSAYKVPAEVHFVDAIPRTGSGKTMRYKLRDALLAERGNSARS
jgi:acyl-CoA synthetase (AMP-forming)/AMP-acid ligase II